MQVQVLSSAPNIRHTAYMIITSSPSIVGIVNLTPDSFSDGGQLVDVDKALFYTEKLIKDGADIIDVGAESSRPGAEPVSNDEEMKRLEPFLSHYKIRFDTPLSLDTYKSDVAEMGLSYGAQLINDITGLQGDPKMAEVIAKAKATAIVMHMKRTPKTMQVYPTYGDVVEEVRAFLDTSIQIAKDAGIIDVIIDPGIGFGKTVEHNLTLLNHLDRFLSLGCPILIGTSRKSFIGELTGDGVKDRLEGTLVSTLMAVEKGARFVRVHDVLSMKKAMTVYSAIKEH